MSRILNLEKGQEVIIRYINDRLRYVQDKTINNIDEWTTIGIVTKIGRKYIEVEKNGISDKFEIEADYKQKKNMGIPNYQLYTSKAEIIEEVKAKALYREVQDYLKDWYNRGKLTLNQLERIADIIKENKES